MSSTTQVTSHVTSHVTSQVTSQVTSHRTPAATRRTTPRASRSNRAASMGAIALSSALLGLLGTAGHVSAAPTPTSPSSTVPSSSTPDSTGSTGSSVPDSSVPGSSVPANSVPGSSVPATGTASPDPAAPIAAPASFTLPLFGVGLTVEITTGPGGALSSVMLNPADGFTAAAARPNKVAFVNADGSTSVVVKSNDGGQRVEARAGSLAEIVGPGGWNGEVFPGVPGSVAFEIVDNGGTPGIVVGTVTGPSAEVGQVEIDGGGSDDGDDDHDEREAKVRIRFSQDGQSRWLTIKAEVDTDDGATRAKVRISLSKITTALAPPRRGHRRPPCRCGLCRDY